MMNIFEAIAIMVRLPFFWIYVMGVAIVALGGYAELRHDRRRTNRRCKKIREKSKRDF